jgi:hypothetical protein
MSKVDEQARHEYRQWQNDETMPQPSSTGVGEDIAVDRIRQVRQSGARE